MRIHLKHVVIACVCVVGVVMLRDGASAPSRRGRPRGVSSSIPSHIPALTIYNNSAAPIFALVFVPRADVCPSAAWYVPHAMDALQFQNIRDSVVTASPIPLMHMHHPL